MFTFPVDYRHEANIIFYESLSISIKLFCITVYCISVYRYCINVEITREKNLRVCVESCFPYCWEHFSFGIHNPG